MSVVHRVSIGGLHSGLMNGLVVGVIIGKQESRRIITRAEGAEKAVAKMTIRDSPDDFINVTFWLNPGVSHEFDSQYHVGDVVEICNPKVQSRDPGSNDERYAPHVSSPCFLTVSEPHSRICKHDVSLSSFDFASLLCFPTKASVNFSTLADVQSNPCRLSVGDHVDILAAIQSVGQVHRFVRKGRNNNQQQQDQEEEGEVREVKLLDQTGSGLVLKLWSSDWIRMADLWEPMRDVLFLADVKVDRDNYKNCHCVGTTGKSIITVNPRTEESQLLVEYADMMKDTLAAAGGSSYWDQPELSVDFNSIRRVVSVVTIQDIVEKSSSSAAATAAPNYASEADRQYTAIVYGWITKLDLDTDISDVFLSRCSRCKSVLPKDADFCPNVDCESPTGGSSSSAQSKINLRLSVSDFTGTLNGCKITADVMERLLSPLDQFLTLTSDERTMLKWGNFLEPLKIWILVSLPTKNRQTPIVNVLNWSKVTLDELASKSHTPPVQ